MVKKVSAAQAKAARGELARGMRGAGPADGDGGGGEGAGEGGGGGGGE